MQLVQPPQRLDALEGASTEAHDQSGDEFRDLDGRIDEIAKRVDKASSHLTVRLDDLESSSKRHANAIGDLEDDPDSVPISTRLTATPSPKPRKPNIKPSPHSRNTSIRWSAPHPPDSTPSPTCPPT